MNTKNEMAGWLHQVNGHELRQTLGDGKGQGAWCASVHGVAKIRTRFGNRTTTTKIKHTQLRRIQPAWCVSDLYKTLHYIFQRTAKRQ